MASISSDHASKTSLSFARVPSLVDERHQLPFAEIFVPPRPTEPVRDRPDERVSTPPEEESTKESESEASRRTANEDAADARVRRDKSNEAEAELTEETPPAEAASEDAPEPVADEGSESEADVEAAVVDVKVDPEVEDEVPKAEQEAATEKRLEEEAVDAAEVAVVEEGKARGRKSGPGESPQAGEQEVPVQVLEAEAPQDCEEPGCGTPEVPPEQEEGEERRERSRRSESKGKTPAILQPPSRVESIERILTAAHSNVLNSESTQGEGQGGEVAMPEAARPIEHASAAPEAGQPAQPTAAPAAVPAGPRLPQQVLARPARAEPPTLSPPETNRFLNRVAKAFETARQRGGPLRLRLSPPELGALRLEVRVQGGALTARLEAETPAARSLLLENLNVLRERLAEQGVRIEQFDVDLMDQQPEHAHDEPTNRGPQERSPDRQTSADEQGAADRNPSGDDPDSDSATPATANYLHGRDDSLDVRI